MKQQGHRYAPVAFTMIKLPENGVYTSGAQRKNRTVFLILILQVSGASFSINRNTRQWLEYLAGGHSD